MIYTLTLNPALDRELTVHELATDEVLRAERVRVDCGGKGFNVSRTLAALGQRSIALGLIGGATGERLRADLAASGVETDFLDVAGETRTNVTIVTADHGRQIKVNEPGPEVSLAEQSALLDKVSSLARAADWWVLSGSLPPGVDGSIYARLISIVQSAGAHALLDTSDEPLRSGCSAGPFLVKPNAREASRLTGVAVAGSEAARLAAARIHDLGVAVVAVSLGSAGAVLSTREGTWVAEPPPVRARNSSGAGDALLAGLLWGFTRRQSPPEALRAAVACGAAAASLDGTSAPPLSVVESLARDVRVTPAA
jgi:1-phosphofructokinase family hexose kinase